MGTAEATLEKRTPLERLELLCDPGSFRALRTGVLSRDAGDRAQAGDGVLAGAGTIGGRPVFCYAQDASFMGGSLGEIHAESIVRVMRQAGRAGHPVIGIIESGGARLQEGHDALAGYARIFRASVELSTKVPQISIVTGISAGGGAYSPALTDYVLMTREACMFLTGPKVVEAALGEQTSMEGLGGARVHERNGVCHLLAETEVDALERCRELVGLLPSQIGEEPPLAAPQPPNGRDPGDPVPSLARKVYDIREVADTVIDANSLLEISPRWAPNMVTAFARVDGRPIGIVANQPKYLGGVIDAAGSEKASLFINSCNRFGLPLLVLVDTPGFMPGTKQEGAGVIRHGASLLRAFAGAEVPKLTLVLRKAYGGAVITMNSKDLGADMVFAWPGAEIGIMAAGQAVDIVHRRRLEEVPDPDGLRDRLVEEYSGEHLNAEAAAARGFVDEVIDPSDTRDRLTWALSTMAHR